MKRLQAYKFELMPNGEQQRDMRRFSGACRFVFNKALALKKDNHEAGDKFIGYVVMAKRLTDWRNGPETPWLKEAPGHPLQHALNWHKAKRRVQKTHTRISNARRDYRHKTSTTISQNRAFVCIEDLQVRNMSKSAAGGTEKPGKNVLAKSGLNKAILDQGWFEFRRQLEYKLGWNGGTLVALPAHNTRKTCPCCGHIAKENRLSQAKFLCVDCGYEENADVVGAVNVLERGHRVAACGEDSSGLGRKPKAKPVSVKQEPTEATMHEVSHA